MKKINVTRVFLGGFAAAVFLFLFSGVQNGVILNAGFQEWAQDMGARLHPQSPSSSMMLWTLMSLIYGVVGVWIYAGIRPRFGAGAKTALLAGLILWLVSKFAVGLDMFALGIFPEPILAGQVLGSLVAMPLATLIGAWIYREEEPTRKIGVV